MKARPVSKTEIRAMLFRMARFFVLCSLIFGSFMASYADTGCSPQAQHSAASEVASIRKQLLAIKVSFGEDGVSESTSVLLVTLKDKLSNVANAVFACHDASATPAILQQELANLLHANRPLPPARPLTDADIEKSISDVYGNYLQVHVARVFISPLILSVTFNFDITCGDDNVLLLFEASDSHWVEKLRWQAPPYTEIKNAFGDFFLSSILPGDSPDAWRVVVAHGTPWCTSNWSAARVDVLAPKPTSPRPQEIRHLEIYYRRNGYVPKMDTDINTVALRLEVNTIETDQLERLGIFRYRLRGDQFDRIQPIATNGRYFVDEWLQMPWLDAARFSDPGVLLKLKPAHDIFATRYKDMNNITSYEYGPVTVCRDDKNHFQVEIDTGVSEADTRPTYYGIQQNGGGYTMLTANSSKPDPHCGGPDLMKKK